MQLCSIPTPKNIFARIKKLGNKKCSSAVYPPSKNIFASIKKLAKFGETLF
jgi:hypothetical protein